MNSGNKIRVNSYLLSSRVVVVVLSVVVVVVGSSKRQYVIYKLIIRLLEPQLCGMIETIFCVIYISLDM